MKIIEWSKGVFYAVRYDGEVKDEYTRVFDYLTTTEDVKKFFYKYSSGISDYYVKNTGIPREEPDEYAIRVVTEGRILDNYFQDLIDNTELSRRPDLDDCFQCLEGYEFYELKGMKGYGSYSPSMVRIYAVKIDTNCYLMVYGGIKIEHSLSKCPELNQTTTKLNKVIEYLKQNSIFDRTGIEEYMESVGH